jgi:hypothetical protein
VNRDLRRERMIAVGLPLKPWSPKPETRPPRSTGRQNRAWIKQQEKEAAERAAARDRIMSNDGSVTEF